MDYFTVPLSYIVSKYVPYGDQLVGKNDQERFNNQIRIEMHTIETANRIIKNFKGNKKLKRSKKVKQARILKKEAESKLAELNFEKNQYHGQQLNKATPLLNLVAPSLGQLTTYIHHGTTARNLHIYSTQTSSKMDIAIKIGKTALPVIASLTKSYWMPVVTSYITPGVIAATAAITLSILGPNRGEKSHKK